MACARLDTWGHRPSRQHGSSNEQGALVSSAFTMLHSGEWLVKKYASLAQPKPNQTLDTTLVTLASRLQQVSGDGAQNDQLTKLPPLPDRRAAVLALKGLARDHPVEVGNKALDAILETLCRDATHDDEIARAVVEACITLCETSSAASHSAPGKDLVHSVCVQSLLLLLLSLTLCSASYTCSLPR